VIASAVAPGATAVNGYHPPTWTIFDFTNVKVMVGEVLAFQPIVTGVNGQVVGLDLAYGDEPERRGVEFQ
jgi:hypothetical protein